MRRIKRGLVWLFLLLVAMTGCIADKDFLASQAAAYTYHEGRYEAGCVEVKGPQECAAFQADLHAAERELKTAGKVHHIGKLPREEKAAIRRALKKAREHL